MAPLVHMVVRQSRTLRDVIVTSCMLDLPQEDVSTALDLGVARVEALLRAGFASIRASLHVKQGPDGARNTWRRAATGVLGRLHQCLSYRICWPDGLALASRRRVQLLLPMLALVLWFAVPMTAVAGVCVALVSAGLHMTGP